MKKAEVDLDRCQGHGKCYMVAPGLFEPIDEEAHSHFRGAGVEEEDKAGMERLRRAVASCPEVAITLVEVR
jgi:ferredoxin